MVGACDRAMCSAVYCWQSGASLSDAATMQLTEIEEADHSVGRLGTREAQHLACLAEMQEDAVHFDDQGHCCVTDVGPGEDGDPEANHDLGGLKKNC